ncbi:protein DOG1-like 4 [Primulina tabacum]|uniref:protein DOG1-like 4 n=1 Tax=Primulina tabacum TaxID=48773 RepID=UPI003F5A2A98
MNSQVAERFTNYYAKWMSQLEDLLKILLLVSRDCHQEAGYEAIVNKFTSHHKELYMIKWALADEDILAFFHSVWLSPLENAYLWITGWKPSMAFRLVDTLISKSERQSGGSLRGMTDEQVEKIEALRVKIGLEEERVESEMERQQVSVADRKMVELVKLEIQAKKNGSPEAVTKVNELVEVALKGMLAGLQKVMKMADSARLKTLKGVLEVLTPRQCVDFLSAMSMLQIQTRKWGLKKSLLNQ